jgi:hypothetical protein
MPMGLDVSKHDALRAPQGLRLLTLLLLRR